uniref:4-hydroxyphenylacetaldehyde oxime monooxygenase n=1 Tax=Aegilops tauschii TaxID=37682 RepID=R7W0Q5_AEGTA
MAISLSSELLSLSQQWQLQLGTVPTVVVSSAEAAREVMKTHDEDCCTRPVSPGMKRLSYGLSNVGFAPYGPYWSMMRKFLLVELFGVRHVKAAWHARQYQAHFLPVIGRLVDQITGLAARRERIFKKLDTFFEIIIEQHLDPQRVKPQNGDLVDRLIGLWKDNSGTLSITRDHVKGIIFGTFIGGSDTASVTILWAMAELIRKPRLQKKVQDEIRSMVGGNESVQPDDLVKLAYLKMVVKETLRLHPPATMLLPREAMRDIQIGGYDVPAKTRIYVNAWAIGRDPTSWPDDPEEFKPERFETSEIDFKGAHFELTPFGARRRICPALSMSIATVEFTLANLLYCFDWALPKGAVVSMEEEGKLIPLLKTPLVLVPTPYRHILLNSLKPYPSMGALKQWEGQVHRRPPRGQCRRLAAVIYHGCAAAPPDYNTTHGSTLHQACIKKARDFASAIKGTPIEHNEVHDFASSS